MLKSIAKIIFILAFFLIILNSCIKVDSKLNTLRINNGAEPTSLDPAVVTSNLDFRIIQNIIEGLTVQNPQDLSPMPGVAESWTVSDDGLVYTFKLRRNSQWSDGIPIDAETFKYSWLRALNPQTGAEYAYQLWYIKNAEAYTTGQIAETEVGIDVVDKYTLEVTLENPTPYFIKLISFITYSPVPKHVIDKVGNDKWFLVNNIVCNGPFKITEWLPNDHISLEKNNKYWDKEKVKLQKILFYPYDDINSALEMFLNNELDWITAIPPERIEQYKTAPEFRSAAFLRTYFYRFNVTLNNPLKDVRVRKALYLTINRPYITSYITKAGEIPAYGFVPRNMPDYKGYDGPSENVEEAKKLLAEAGYPNGKNFPKFSILYNTSGVDKQIAEAIQQMWREALNINVELINHEWKVYLDRQKKLDYTISRSSWGGDYVDPNTFLDMFITDSGNNRTGWSNKEYDELIDQAKLETNPDKRMNLFYRAEEILLTEFPIIPIYYVVNTFMVKTNVKGIFANILDDHPLKEVYIEENQ